MPRAPARAARVISVLLTLAAATAAAQPGPSYSWGLGVGGITQQQPYKDINRDSIPIPLLMFENRWVKLLGPYFDLKLHDLHPGENQQISLTLTSELIGFDGYSSKDAPILNGMSQRKGGNWLGPSIEWDNPYVDVSAKWLYDVSGSSKGQKLTMAIARTHFVGHHWMLTPSVSAIWMNRQYVDYYYGVRASEVRADRPAYLADSTLNVEVALRTQYLIDQHQSLFLSAGYVMLGSAIKESPLTDRTGASKLLLGYLYRF